MTAVFQAFSQCPKTILSKRLLVYLHNDDKGYTSLVASDKGLLGQG